MSKLVPVVAANQTWTDPRNPTRRIEVESVDIRYAYCRSWWTDRSGSGRRKTRIELWTFRRYERLATKEGS